MFSIGALGGIYTNTRLEFYVDSHCIEYMISIHYNYTLFSHLNSSFAGNLCDISRLQCWKQFQAGRHLPELAWSDSDHVILEL